MTAYQEFRIIICIDLD